MADDLQVITANRTDDGAVVYLCTGEGSLTWTRAMSEATTFSDAAGAQQALAQASVAETVVTDPYLLKVQHTEGKLAPRSAREDIRREGPSATLERLGYGPHRSAGVGGDHGPNSTDHGSHKWRGNVPV